MYEISTGRRPAELHFTALEESDSDHPRFGAWLAILRKACEKDALQRYQTVTAFARDIATLKQKPRRRKWLILLAVGLVLSLIVLKDIALKSATPSPAETTPPEHLKIPLEPMGFPDASLISFEPKTNWIAMADNPAHRAPAEILLNFAAEIPQRDPQFACRIYADKLMISVTPSAAAFRSKHELNDTIVFEYLSADDEPPMLRLESFTDIHNRIGATPITWIFYSYPLRPSAWRPALFVPLSDTAPEYQAFPAQIWILPDTPPPAMLNAIYQHDVETFIQLWREWLPDAEQITMRYQAPPVREK